MIDNIKVILNYSNTINIGIVFVLYIIERNKEVNQMSCYTNDHTNAMNRIKLHFLCMLKDLHIAWHIKGMIRELKPHHKK